MIDDITLSILLKGSLYVLVSVLAMVTAFVYSWAQSDKDEALFFYLTGDKKQMTKALAVLVTSWSGAGIMDLFDALSYQQVIALAAANGLAVPKKMETKNASSD